MNDIRSTNEAVENDLYGEIKELVIYSRNQISAQINETLLRTYWEIGKRIVTEEQHHSERAEYGKELLKNLSKALTREFGRGFSKSNLFNMRKFYLLYPIFQTLSGKLSWSHYSELLSISDENRRSFYEKESQNAGWSVRENGKNRQENRNYRGRLFVGTGAFFP